MEQDYPRRVGIVGTGNLASFMVAGTTRAGREVAFTVSPRGRDLSARLARDYGVEVATGNQEAVTGADLVLVSVLPGQAEEALAGLAFGPEQVVLSVMAGVALEKVSRLVAPAQAACALMPGHANALGLGPSVLYPDLTVARAFLEPLGPVHGFADAESFLVATVSGGYSGCSFPLMVQAIRWFAAQGMDPDEARKLVAGIWRGNAETLLRLEGAAFEALIAGVATPGGLTEQGRATLGEAGAFAAWDQALDGLLARLRKDWAER